MNATHDRPLRSDRTPAENFEEFNARNPQVFETLIDCAVEFAVETGAERISAVHLVNHVRWRIALETRDANSIRKINNDYTPFYARLLAWTANGLVRIELRDAPEADEWADRLGAPVSPAYYLRHIAI